MAAHPVGAMVLGAAGCLGVTLALTGRPARLAVLLGMAGPLAVTVGSWLWIARTHARGPERVAGLMIKQFAGKMIVFGAYIAACVAALSGGAVTAFVASFTAHYIVLHVIEALCLRRLFAAGPAAMRG